GFGTRIVGFKRGSRASNSTDRVIADFNGYSATERKNVDEIPLCSLSRILCGPLLKFRRRDPKHASGVGLPSRHLGGLRSRLFVTQKDYELPGAINDCSRRAKPFCFALRKGRFRYGFCKRQ